MRKWLLFVAFFLVAIQGVASREPPRDGISSNEHYDVHFLKTAEEPRSSELAQSTGKPTGISQLLPKENGSPQGMPVSPQNLGESKGFAQIPQKIEVPREFPAGNTKTKLLSAPTRNLAEENIFTKNRFKEDIAAVHHEKTPETNTATNNDKLPPGTLHAADHRPAQQSLRGGMRNIFPTKDKQLQFRSVDAADIPASQEDDMHERFRHKIKDFGSVLAGATNVHHGTTYNTFTPKFSNLQSGKVYATDILPSQADDHHNSFLPKVIDLQSGGVHSESGSVDDRFLPKVNDSIFAESDKKDEFKDMRPINSEEITSNDVLIPPTTSSVRFSSRGRYRVRRKRRSRAEEVEDARRSSKIRLVNFDRKSTCDEEMSRTSYVVWAVTGWSVAGLFILITCIKCGCICEKRCRDDDLNCQCRCHFEDVESGQADETSDTEAKEISMYEKHNRRPTGYCNIEIINEESLTSLPVSEPITVALDVEKKVENKTMVKETIGVEEGLTNHGSLPEPMTVVMEMEEDVQNKTVVKETIVEEGLTNHGSLPEPMTVVMEMEEDVQNKIIVKEAIVEEGLNSHCSLPEPMTVVMEMEQDVQNKIVVKEAIVEEGLGSHCSFPEPMTVNIESETEVVEKECKSINKEIIAEKISESLPPLPPPMPTKKIKKKVRFQSDICDKEQHQRRPLEKVKIIRKLSSSIHRPSLLDEIEIAQEVIMDNRGNDNKSHERRKVIKEVTSNERKGSLLEEIQFAREVILPSDDDKEKDENAFHRRHLIKQRSSSRRTSLLDNVTMAMEVIYGSIETVV